MMHYASVLVVNDPHDITRPRYTDEQVVASAGCLDEKSLTNILNVSHSVTPVLKQGDDVVRSKRLPRWDHLF